MAKQIEFICPDAPSAGLTATLSAGGNLVDGTTYYYRVISLYRSPQNNNALSEASAEVSATATSTNGTITVSWDAVTGATHYIVQRTTTSGSYPVNGNNSLHIYGYSNTYNFATTQTQIIDDNVALSKVDFVAYNFDHDVSYPLTHIKGDSTDDIIYLEDVYQKALTDGETHIDKICTDNWKSHTGTYWTMQVPFIIRGSVYTSNCDFRLYGMLYVDTGTFNGTGKLTFGTEGGAYRPYIFYNQYYSFMGTVSNNSWDGGYLYCGEGIRGSSGSLVYDLIERPVMTYNSSTTYPYASGVWYNGISANANGIYERCTLGYKGENGAPTYDAGSYKDTLFEACRPYAENMTDVTFTEAQLSFTWRQNNKLTRPFMRYPMIYECLWGSTYGSQMTDPRFESKGQTDNQPYWACVFDYRGVLDATMLIKHTLKINIVDDNADPIEGVTVKIYDQNGYSDLWEDTGATLYYESGDTTKTDIRLIDNSLVSVGDVVQIEGYGEKMLVTEVAGAVDMTVQRGYQGTTARSYNGQYNPRVLRQIDSITTDANGLAEPDEAMTNRELVINTQAKSYGYHDWEDGMVEDGYLVRNYHTPHTVVISKDGYKTISREYTIADKMEQTEVLPELTGLTNFAIVITD